MPRLTTTEGLPNNPKDAPGSVWLREDPQRNQQTPLSRNRIVSEAIKLLDAHGKDQLTMRNLARALGVGPTTLYWHVRTKDDVVELSTDEIFLDVQLPRVSPNWKEDIRSILTETRAVLLQHPWATNYISGGTSLCGPNFLGIMEFIRMRLNEAGFSQSRVSAASWLAISHVAGSAQSQAHIGTDKTQNRQVQEIISQSSEYYPTLAAGGYLFAEDWDTNFRLGLDVIITGIENSQPTSSPDKRSNSG